MEVIVCLFIIIININIIIDVLLLLLFINFYQRFEILLNTSWMSFLGGIIFNSI